MGNIGPPGEVKLYKHAFNLVLVVILNSMPAEISYITEYRAIISGQSNVTLFFFKGDER